MLVHWYFKALIITAVLFQVPYNECDQRLKISKLEAERGKKIKERQSALILTTCKMVVFLLRNLKILPLSRFVWCMRWPFRPFQALINRIPSSCMNPDVQSAIALCSIMINAQHNSTCVQCGDSHFQRCPHPSTDYFTVLRVTAHGILAEAIRSD